MKLEQQKVTRYAKYNALKNLLEAWLKPVREEMVKALQSGARCPTKGPYVLELGPSEGRVDWKDEFVSWLYKQGYTESQAENVVLQIERKPRPGGVRLYCRANPQYGQKFVPGLPAL